MRRERGGRRERRDTTPGSERRLCCLASPSERIASASGSSLRICGTFSSLSVCREVGRRVGDGGTRAAARAAHHRLFYLLLGIVKSREEPKGDSMRRHTRRPRMLIVAHGIVCSRGLSSVGVTLTASMKSVWEKRHQSKIRNDRVSRMLNSTCICFGARP